MLKPKKRWHTPAENQGQIDGIIKNSKLNPLVAKVLALRGFTTVEEIQGFLNSDINHFHNPFQLSGMKEAVNRIQRAILKSEPILIYGDYDADGVTSTSLLYKTLQSLDANFDYYIPNRFTEGYGLNEDAIREAAINGFKLIITVDTGISAIKEADIARELGVDLIITDHHEPQDVLPEAYAIINPKKPNDTYPFKNLAGVGVAFKLAHALLNRIPMELIDIASIGTVADLVPLIDENRIIVSYGLKQFKSTKHVGIRALLETTGLWEKEKITAGHIGFVIGPRINAGGRLDTAEHAVALFIEQSIDKAMEKANYLDQLNQERQALVNQITKEALELIDSQNLHQDRVLIIAKEDWNVGVIGIVASRILETYYRPTIILSIDSNTGIAKGSARSIDGYNIFQALTETKDILPHYGGHPAAAGLSIDQSNIMVLREKLNQIADKWLTEEDFIPIEKYDATCSLEDINLELIKELSQLEPFGMGNPSPKFLIKNAEVIEISSPGKNIHLKLTLQNEKQKIDAIGFQWGSTKDKISYHSQVEMIGEFSINEWNGVIKPQIIFRDLQIPTLQVFDYRNNQDYLYLLKESEHLKGTTVLIYDQTASDFDINNQQWHTHSYQALNDRKILNKGLASIKNIVFYHLPPSVRVLQQIIKELPYLERIYCVYGNNSINSGLQLPDRKLMAKVYSLIKKEPSLRSVRKAEQFFIKHKISSEILQFILDVFIELDFIIVSGDEIKIVPNPMKKELQSSKLYQQQLELDHVKQLFLYSNPKSLRDWFIEQR